MHQALVRTRSVLCGIPVVIIASGLSGHGTVGAQSSTPPAVRVVREEAVRGRVWPADMNRDGITDLVSSDTGSPSASFPVELDGNLQVSIGRGDGTFDPPTASSVRGIVLGVGDFNGDGRPDVIAASLAAHAKLIVRGTGTAALGAAATVGPAVSENLFAVSADFNGDNHRDLVIPGSGSDTGDGIKVYPGNGDFTFDAPVTLIVGFIPRDGIVADWNNDGRRDLAIAAEAKVTVFNNQGGFLFTPNDIPIPWPGTDAAAADINGDGRQDLLVSVGRSDAPGLWFGHGQALVMRGDGDGTFAAPATYELPKGPMQIVAGDFNRDGVVDVATVNKSAIGLDDPCAPSWKTWDSVSILRGTGGGAFAAPRTFSVGDQSLSDPGDPEDGRFRATATSLNTSDLNRDGHLDLIASEGALLFNRAPTANRAPTVNAGRDRVIVNIHEAQFFPTASDPDEDMLGWEIRNEHGELVENAPNSCTTELHDGANPFTVTVNDGRGGVASDSVVYTVRMSEGDLGYFVVSEDIGSVGTSGSSSWDSGTDIYTVTGSGADIWGTADEFHYLWTQFGTDTEMTARVDSIQNVNAWTKAGLMIRENLNAGARHVSLFATPGKGVAFQRRTAVNGSSVHTAGPSTTAPVWLKLSRVGDVISAYYRKQVTDAWTLIGRQTLAGLAPDALLGLAVSSHADGARATARFSNVAVVSRGAWSGAAIGSGSGSATSDGVVFTVSGRGADIWGSSDAFYYVHQPRNTTNLVVTARVRSVTNAHAWAKAGIMLRETLAANARHVMAVVTPGKGVAMQYRANPGSASAQAANIPGSAPGWVRLARNVDTFTASWSKDGVNWTALATVTIPFNTEFLVGLPVTSHTTGATATAVFDDVTIGYN